MRRVQGFKHMNKWGTMTVDTIVVEGVKGEVTHKFLLRNFFLDFNVFSCFRAQAL